MLDSQSDKTKIPTNKIYHQNQQKRPVAYKYTK